VTLVRYTADGGHYRIGGYGFDPGDEKDVDDELAEYLEGHDDFEITELPEPTDLTVDDAESEKLPFSPESHTVAEIEERIAEIEDPDTLRALRNLEQEQKNRETATAAIEGQLSDMEA